MKGRIRLLALDLDGTTLNSAGELSDFNRNALLKAHEAGMHIVVASGRSFSSLPEEILSLPCVEYAITSNGASVYEVKGGKRLQAHYLKKAAVEKLLAIAKEAEVTVEGFVGGIPYAQYDYVEDPVKFGGSAYSVDYAKKTRMLVENIFSFLLEHGEELDSLDFIVGEVEKKKELHSYILREVKDIYLTSSVSTLLEISDSHAGKASGLRFLADHLGIFREEAAAFGNAENDMDMMVWAGIGVAVANSPKNVCEAADEIIGTNDEDGVGRWIEQYLCGKTAHCQK